MWIMSGGWQERSVKCKSCGASVDCLFRFCPACGGRIHIPLERTNAKPEMFIDLMNSLYSLLVDKNNASRTKYLPALSENAMTADAGSNSTMS
jgi:hypothetical protein